MLSHMFVSAWDGDGSRTTQRVAVELETDETGYLLNNNRARCAARYNWTAPFMEPTVIVSAAVSGLVREGVRTAVDSVRAHISNSSEWTWSEAALASHLEWTASWSAGIQIGDMSRSEPIEARTIPLYFAETGSRFRDSDNEPALSERDLLSDHHPYLIEGDPGGGKTTAIKRICRLLLAEAEGPGDHWQYPMLVVLRSLPKARGLIAYLGHMIGLAFEVPSPGPQLKIRDFGRSIRCEGQTLLDVVVRTLNETGAVLLLDGIDELDPDERVDIEAEIQDLVHLLAGCKLIMTTRLGSLTRTIESVRRSSIIPLNAEQQREIASRWTGGGGDRFFEELQRRPYADLGNRPLFLAWLLLLYQREKSLPFQACDVYQRVVRLLLEDWDRERDVTRLSRYANFGPDQKLRFLAALSHQLLLATHRVAFQRRDLERAYVILCDGFQLPELQAEQVAQEIVSHTGLIVRAGFDQYEFSHLSLQEYLCAHHILRDPLKGTFLRYLSTYPAPLAIAAAMSASPSSFLALLALSEDAEAGAPRWDVFLDRIALESPRFTLGVDLGLGMLKVLSDRPELEELMFAALSVNTDQVVLLKAMASAIAAYQVREFAEKAPLTLMRVANLGLSRPLKQPERLQLQPGPILKLMSIGARLVTRLPDGNICELAATAGDDIVLRSSAQRNWRPQAGDGWDDVPRRPRRG